MVFLSSQTASRFASFAFLLLSGVKMSVANEHGRASHMWREELEAGKEKEVRFLIDGCASPFGATYTLLPT